MSKCCEAVKHFSSLGVPCSSIVDESDATKIELRSKSRFQVPRYIGLVGGNLCFFSTKRKQLTPARSAHSFLWLVIL